MKAICMICLNEQKYRALLPCNHNDFCIECIARMKECYGSNTCPMCRNVFEKDPIIVPYTSNITYEEAESKKYPHDDKTNFYYSSPKILSLLREMNKIKCTICSHKFHSLKELSLHTKKIHNQEPCRICFHSHRFLKCQTPLFPTKQIMNHVKQHPKCKLCNYTAYDDHELSEHTNSKHFRCDIRAKEGNILWFKDYDEIQKHFQEKHFACKHVECIQQGFVVFETQFELDFHLISVHHENITLDIYGNDETKQTNTNESNIKESNHKNAMHRLTKSAKKIFKNKKKLDELFALIRDINSNKLQIKEFLDNFKNLCDENANALFCDSTAAIKSPKKRAELMHLYYNI